MKTIFAIFSSTDLRSGKMIRYITKNEYNHCSICLSEDLSEFYSFSRIYRSNPLIAGFTVESPNRYTLSAQTKLKIVAVPVCLESFLRAREMIREMCCHKEKYVYNFFSAAAYPFGRRFARENAFTCAEFTNKVLKTAGVSMPERANIEQMEHALSEYPTWEGRAVDGFFQAIWGEDRYLEHIGKARQCFQIASRFKKLVVGK